MDNCRYDNVVLANCVINAICELPYQSPSYLIQYGSELFRIVLYSRYCLVNTGNEFCSESLSAIFIVLVGFGDIRFGFLPNG